MTRIYILAQAVIVISILLPIEKQLYNLYVLNSEIKKLSVYFVDPFLLLLHVH